MRVGRVEREVLTEKGLLLYGSLQDFSVGITDSELHAHIVTHNRTDMDVSL